MSLYNALFGVNPVAPVLMAALNLDNEAPENWSEKFEVLCDGWGEPNIYSELGQALLKEGKESGYYPTGRFRDIYFENENEQNEPKIILYTRNGGGNREWYEYVFELLSAHPLYIRNYDDDYDSTYAYIEFRAPQVVIDFFEGVKTGKIENVSEKFKAEIEAVENGKAPKLDIIKIIEKIVETVKD